MSAEVDEVSNVVPTLRIRRAGSGEVQPSGDYVLYWMTAFRRTEWNFALQQAVNWAVKLRAKVLSASWLASPKPYPVAASHALWWQVVRPRALLSMP